MDTAWIQVFVLSLSECVAPTGKTVCQQHDVHYQFYDLAECETVLRQLLDYKAKTENIIVDEDNSRCLPTVRQSPTFASLQEANRQLGDTENWGEIPVERDEPRIESGEHQARLAKLPACDDSYSVTPCKVGQIIVESDASKEVPVWRKDDGD